METEGEHVANKAEIDSSAPFRSVKEAVILFGDKILTSEVYGSRLKETQEDRTISEYANLTLEQLEEAKQSLQKAREESVQMASTVFFLQQELEKTKMELQQLKTCESSTHSRVHYSRDNEFGLDILEDIKFVEEDGDHIKDIDQVELHKNKCVRFASPPCVVSQLISPENVLQRQPENVLQRQPSLRRKKKKQVIEFIRGIFSKRS